MDLFTVENLVALLSLASLEIVLGIDNVIFIAILVGRLPAEQRDLARRIGLLGAMFMRIGLLLAISWMSRLTDPLFTIVGFDFSGRNLILLCGGAFLIMKATLEIHEKMEVEDDAKPPSAPRSFWMVIGQVILVDIVFSLDSVITAVGLAQHIVVMVLGIVAAVIVMMIFSGPITTFIDRHPTFKILALSFLILVGVLLVAEGLGQHVDKGYIYFAMAFSFVVEMLNTKMRVKKDHPA